MAQLSDDLTELVSEPEKIVSGRDCPLSVEVGDDKCRGYIAEGPWLYEEDGCTVLLWSTVTASGYSVLKSISKNSAMGDYILEKSIFD